MNHPYIKYAFARVGANFPPQPETFEVFIASHLLNSCELEERRILGAELVEAEMWRGYPGYWFRLTREVKQVVRRLHEIGKVGQPAPNHPGNAPHFSLDKKPPRVQS